MYACFNKVYSCLFSLYILVHVWKIESCLKCAVCIVHSHMFIHSIFVASLKAMSYIDTGKHIRLADFFP